MIISNIILMKKLIVISDWSNDSISSQEFSSVVEGFVKNSSGIRINYVSTSSSTIEAGFLLHQIQIIEDRFGRSQNLVIFTNVDTRSNPETSQNGSPFIIAKLRSGMILCGPNSGYIYSLVKKNIERVFYYEIESKITQFRSRDIYARICAHLLDDMESEMLFEEQSLNVIPELRDYYIGHIDNFGNIKTTIPTSFLKGKFEKNDRIPIHIQGILKSVVFSKGLFSEYPNELKIFSGSSGVIDDPFLEIAVWQPNNFQIQKSALSLFHNPSAGEKILI